MAGKRIKKLFQRYPLARSISVMMSGTVVAQLLTFVLQPIVSRVYTPAEIGMLGVFLTIPQIVVVMAGMRYELTLMMPRRDVDARQIMRMCLIISVTIALILTAIGFFFGNWIAHALGQPKLAGWMPLLGVQMLFLYLPTLLNYWLTRKLAYKALASNRVLTVIATTGTRIAAPFVHVGGMWGLMLSQLLGQAVSFLNLARVAKRIGYKTVADEVAELEAAKKADAADVAEAADMAEAADADSAVGAVGVADADSAATAEDEILLSPVAELEATDQTGAMTDEFADRVELKPEAEAKTEPTGAGLGVAAPRSMRSLAWQYRKMPLLNMPNALVDAVRINGLVAIIGISFGQAQVGQFVQSWNLIQAATMFIVASLSQVFFQKYSNAKPGEMRRLVSVSVAISAAFAIPVFGILALISPWLIPIYLGKQWYTAGLVTQALCPWLAVNVMTGPISTVYIAAEKQERLLVFAIVYAVVPIASIFMCVRAGFNLVQSTWVMSGLQAFLLICMLLMTLWTAREFDNRSEASLHR